MNIKILPKDTWVGVFDILGFKNEIEKLDNEYNRMLLESKLKDLYQVLESDIMDHGKIKYFAFSDTIVLFTQNMKIESYPWFLLQCEQLIIKSICVELPLRGAMSFGTAYINKNPIMIMGEPFVEAFEYAEDQDWIGLLLTPSATKKVRENGLEPQHHHYIESDIPLRQKEKNNVLAFRFQKGSANFKCPYIPFLKSMKSRAPDSSKHKYQRTIDFITTNYKWIK